MQSTDTASLAGNLSRRDRLALLLEYQGNRWLRGLGTALYRLTGGRIAPRSRVVVLLTTRGRRSGREHTVLLQGFPDGAGLVVVAANSGRPAHPDWLHNLRANPTARVKLLGCTQEVRAAELSEAEAGALWPHILRRAPTYARYLAATARPIPLVRLVPAEAPARAARAGG